MIQEDRLIIQDHYHNIEDYNNTIQNHTINIQDRLVMREFYYRFTVPVYSAWDMSRQQIIKEF